MRSADCPSVRLMMVWCCSCTAKIVWFPSCRRSAIKTREYRFAAERLSSTMRCSPYEHGPLNEAASHIMKTLVVVVLLLSIEYVSSAEEIGATGMWINDRKSPDQPLWTGMILTNSPADKAGIKSGCF